MSFLRHEEAYRSDVAGAALGATTMVVNPSSSSLASMSVPVGYSLAGCSPAEPASASPTIDLFLNNQPCRTIIFQRTVTTPLTLCLSPRVHFKLP
jgi:hypothetical protein